MKRSWQKVVLLSLLGFLVAVDLIHEVLNRIFHPFTGPLDTAMHFVLPAASVFYFIACIWVCFQLAKWFSTTKFLSEGYYTSSILLVLIISQLTFTLLTPARSGSSRYHPLFPDFLGGIILSLATMIAGREHLRSHIGRSFVVLVFFFWLAGTMTVDLLWWTEGTERGVGPAWQLPLITPMLAAVSYIFIFGGPLVGACLDFPEAIFKVGSVFTTVWLFVLAMLLAWCLRWLTPSRTWVTSIALAASAVFLGWKTVEWSSFIAD